MSSHGKRVSQDNTTSTSHPPGWLKRSTARGKAVTCGIAVAANCKLSAANGKLSAADGRPFAADCRPFAADCKPFAAVSKRFAADCRPFAAVS